MRPPQTGSPGQFVVLLLVTLAGCTQPPAPGATATAARSSAPPQRSTAQQEGRIDASRLIGDLETLSSSHMEGRATGTEGARRAQTYILRRFKELGLEPVNGSYEHRFVPAPTGRRTPASDEGGVNLVGLIRGTIEPQRLLLITAHYDHLGVRSGRTYHGADDNASGVGAALAVAGWFSTHPPRTSLLVVAFDAEEGGLQGSTRFVETPPVDLSRVDAVMNLDMVGRGDKNVLFVAGTYHYPHLKGPVLHAAEGRTLKVAFGHDRPGAGARDDWTQLSDHAPFHAAGVPFLYFGVEDHPDYHKPTDTADRIPRGFYREAAEVILDTAIRIMEATPPPRGARLGEGRRVSHDEQRIVAAVDARNGEAVSLLERVVNINSGSMNFTGVREVGDVFRAELDGLGFATRWIDGTPFGRAGHLVGERAGTGPRVLLIGHLDTVFEPDSPFQRFERVDASTARGPGIIDMKGGDVVMIHALKALAAAGALDSLYVRVVMTGDEELPGEPLTAARAALIDAARGMDVAIGYENGPGDPRTAVIARRGTTAWQLRVTGKPAHSSQVFSTDVGHGAIYEMARILDRFRETLSGEEHLTFNPGVMLGGTSVDFDPVHARGSAFGKENVVAGHAVAVGDIRTLSLEQLKHAKTRMQEIVGRPLPHTESSITFEEGYPPLAPSEGNRRMLALYDQASRDVGAGPVGAVSPDRAGAADVSFVAGEVRMILDGVGLMGHSDHTTRETADLSTLPSQTKRAAILLYRIARGALR